MMKTKLWLLSTILVISLAGTAASQEVFEREQGIFTTEKIVETAAIKPTAAA